MRTTLRLDDELMSRAKVHAALHHRTLTSVVEEGIRHVLNANERGERRDEVMLPTSGWTGGVRAGVDLDDTAALLDLLDEDATP
jgi:plasmid stability protein